MPVRLTDWNIICNGARGSIRERRRTGHHRHRSKRAAGPPAVADHEGMTEVPAEIAERLYAAEPHLFVAGRDAAVAAARAAGDTRGAAAIAALRKPTVAAWLVNL